MMSVSVHATTDLTPQSKGLVVLVFQYDKMRHSHKDYFDTSFYLNFAAIYKTNHMLSQNKRDSILSPPALIQALVPNPAAVKMVSVTSPGNKSECKR